VPLTCISFVDGLQPLPVVEERLVWLVEAHWR
jgi:hypothetical protein